MIACKRLMNIEHTHEYRTYTTIRNRLTLFGYTMRRRYWSLTNRLTLFGCTMRRRHWRTLWQMEKSTIEEADAGQEHKCWVVWDKGMVEYWRIDLEHQGSRFVESHRCICDLAGYMMIIILDLNLLKVNGQHHCLCKSEVRFESSIFKYLLLSRIKTCFPRDKYNSSFPLTSVGLYILWLK